MSTSAAVREHEQHSGAGTEADRGGMPWAIATLVLGVISFVTTLLHLHVVASWTGSIGLLTGLWAQYISSSSTMRLINVCGWVAAGLGLAFGLAHGGWF